MDFDALQERLSSGQKRRRELARADPDTFVFFDVLAHDGEDVRGRSYDERRSLLEQLAGSWQPPLALSPVTSVAAVAGQWMRDMAAAGIEGVVVKGGAQPYRPGQRAWLKVKRRHTVDVIIGAVIGPIEQPEALVVGVLTDTGDLRIAGRSTPLKPAQARSVGHQLRAPLGPHPWPETVLPGAVDRFTSNRDPIHLTLVEPVVGEVSADVARTRKGSFRHGVRFVRLRPDL